MSDMPDWLKRSLESASAEVATWPQWKKDAMRVLPEKSLVNKDGKPITSTDPVRVCNTCGRAVWTPVPIGEACGINECVGVFVEPGDEVFSSPDVRAIVEVLRRQPNAELRQAIMFGVTDYFCRNCWRTLEGDEYCHCENDE